MSTTAGSALPSATVTLCVAGNLLLLGEYAVLEEGGLGLALAVEPRVQVRATTSDDLRIDGSWPGGAGRSPFVDSAVRVTEEHLGRPCTGALHVDSRALYSADGRKTGLGSSAAVTVSVVCALLALAGESARGEEAATVAVRSHRAAQNGRGSGYDVLASFHGGAGVVRGGRFPSWEPCGLPAGFELFLFPGSAPVSTADAVGRYERWKTGNPGPARDFLAQSNDAIGSFLRSPTADQLHRSLGSCRRLGSELGRAIGVSAEIALPPGLNGAWCKAVGAGNELGACLVPPGAPRPSRSSGCRPLRLAAEGVLWER